jgi:aquaporin Z
MQIRLDKLFPYFIAEFTGTFFLALTVLHVSTGNFKSLIPVAVAGIVCLMVYLLGSVSGGHFNPSVTLGLLSVRKISLDHAIANIIGQLAGSFFAFEIGARILHTEISLHNALSTEWFYEFIGAFILSFAVAAVVRNKVSQTLSGFLIGLALFLGILISERVSGAILNPALVLGIGLLDSVYLIAPIIGGVSAQYIYLWLHPEK